MIEILRLSHRPGRDPRVTTHLFLTARAFGASKGFYSGNKDNKLEDSINKVIEKFGGGFKISFIDSAGKLIQEKKKQDYKIIHLTMYGIQIQNRIKEIRKHKNILLIVGGEKVEPKYYELSDYNIAITNQPHSEISAVCCFLDYYFNRKELGKTYKNAKVEIRGVEKGKSIIKSFKR